MSAYSHILRRILLPVHGMVRGRKYLERSVFLEGSQWWPAERLRAFQWEELQRLLKHAFRSVPYYQETYKRAGIRLEDIRTPADFARLPMLSRAEVNEHRDQLRSSEYPGKLLPHATGGSSGTPTRFYRTLESYDWRTAAKDRVYSWAGLHPGERSAYLWGAPVGKVSPLQSLKGQVFECVQRQLMINTFSQSETTWESVHRRLVRFRPAVVVGYVSSLEEFAKFLLRRGLQIEPLRATIAAAEPVYSTTRATIEQAFGAPLFNTYGCREFMSLAGECECRDGMHVNTENVVLETTLPPTEGPSEVLVTDLHNYGMPFIRYSIGDLAVLDEAPCNCGRGLPRIRRLEGRVLDALRTPDGKLVPGEFFPHVLKDIPEILQFRVEQDRSDHLVIRAVLDTELSDRSQKLLRSEMTKIFTEKMRWDICRVAEIRPLASGKRRITVGPS